MTVRILQGDCRSVLANLPDESVHMVCTSPPYFGLRNYLPNDHPDKAKEIGLEPTMQEHLACLVDVFREVRRVLRRDGVLFINYGDAYANDGKWGGETGGKQAYLDDETRKRTGREKRTTGLPPKCRMMLPARLAIALCDDGWVLRDEIVWAKVNPMPQPARGRTTPAHEMIYMFAKSKRYFYDHEAIAEPIAESSKARYAQSSIDSQSGGSKQDAYESGITGATARSRRPNEIIKDLASKQSEDGITTRIKRSVWTVPTEPFSEAHFATYATAIVEPMIRAGTSEKGCCAECWAPWIRKTEIGYSNPGNRTTNGPRSLERRHETPGFSTRLQKHTETTGWSPSCKCDADIVPCTVLDPFIGSGTTALVCDRLGRDCIGIELNPETVTMALHRVKGDFPLFAQVETEAAE